MTNGDKTISKANGKHGMVSTASKQATDAGVEMLELGGNAIDAAVAAALCLGVSEPQASGIGGQSMVLLYLKEQNRIFTLDGSSRAPYVIQPSKNPNKPLKYGIRSSTVPSTLATLGYMQERYGRLPFDTTVQPAIRAARDGVKVTKLIHRLIKREEEHLRKDPTILSNFFKGNEPLAPGDILKQPELAACLTTLSKAGWRDFYTGNIGYQIIKDMEKRDGLITLADLSQIPFPVEREALKSSYREYDIYTFPPPGAGRVLVQILNTLEGFDPFTLDPDEPRGALILSLAFRFALNYRQKMPIHPDHYLQSVNKIMVDKAYAVEIANRMKDILSIVIKDSFPPPSTSGETTHLSVVDREGNAVGITQSIELVFGSKTMADGLGFFYNNYMSAFEYKNMAHPYYLLPGGRPWSSVAPVLLFKEGRAKYLLGSPGSSRISTTLAQIITRLVDKGEQLDTAIDAPRFHASDTGELMIEQKRFKEEVMEALHLASFEIKKREPYSFYLGCVQGIEIPDLDTGSFFGVADPRRDGKAKGPRNIS